MALFALKKILFNIVCYYPFEIDVRCRMRLKLVAGMLIWSLFANVSANAFEPLTVKYGQKIPKAIKHEDYYVEPPAEDSNIPALVNTQIQLIPGLPGYSLWTYKMFGITKAMQGQDLQLRFKNRPTKIGVRTSEAARISNATIVAANELKPLNYADSLYDSIKEKDNNVIFEKKMPVDSKTMIISLIGSTEQEGHLKDVLVKAGSKSFKFALCGPLLEGEPAHIKLKNPPRVDERHFPHNKPGNG